MLCLLQMSVLEETMQLISESAQLEHGEDGPLILPVRPANSWRTGVKKPYLRRALNADAYVLWFLKDDVRIKCVKHMEM